MIVSHAKNHTPQELFGVNKFQHQQAEIQEDLRRQLGLRTDVPLTYGLAARGADPREDLLRTHFRLLTFCDRISLELCFGQNLFDSIDEVPLAANIKPVSIKTMMPDANRAMLSPWPFGDARPISVGIYCTQLPYRIFDSQSEYQEILSNTKKKLIQFQLQIGR